MSFESRLQDLESNIKEIKDILNQIVKNNPTKENKDKREPLPLMHCEFKYEGVSGIRLGEYREINIDIDESFTKGKIVKIEEIAHDNTVLLSHRYGNSEFRGCLDINQVKFASNPIQIDFERGTWVKITNFGNFSPDDQTIPFTINKPYRLIGDLGINQRFSVGSDDSGNGLASGLDFPYSSGMRFEACTTEEIASHLIKEAKRKFNNDDFVLGVRTIKLGEKFNPNMINSYHWESNELLKNLYDQLGKFYFYKLETDTLYNWELGALVVYENGKWAKKAKSPQDLHLETEKKGLKIGLDVKVVSFNDNSFLTLENNKEKLVILNRRQQEIYKGPSFTIENFYTYKGMRFARLDVFNLLVNIDSLELASKIPDIDLFGHKVIFNKDNIEVGCQRFIVYEIKKFYDSILTYESFTNKDLPNFEIKLEGRNYFVKKEILEEIINYYK